MNRNAVLLTAVFVAFSTIAAAPTTSPSAASRYDDAFLSGNTQLVWDHASPAMRELFGSPQKLKAFRDSALGKRPTAKGVEQTTARGADTLVRTVTTAAGQTLKITWTVDAKSEQIVGLLVKPVAPAEAAAAKADEAAAQPPTDAVIRTTLRKWVDTHHVAPGIVVGIIDDKGSRVLTYGKRELGKPEAVSGETLFEIGSSTKVFTTALLAEMADRGEVKLDDPVAKFLPATAKMPSRNGKQITLLDLATHTSGLPSAPENAPFADGDDPWADYTVPLLYEYLSTCKLSRDVGASFEYSNLGMGLLGHALGLAGKSDYESLVVARICEPLKMSSTRITLTSALEARLARGHSAFGPPVKNWKSGALLGDGALFSSANDMLKFLAANMRKNPSALATAIEKTHRPLHDAGPFNKIGLGWHISSANGENGAVWHNGQTGGFHSYVAFHPQRRRGVVVLANSANSIDLLGAYVLGETSTLDDPKVPTQRRVARVDQAALERCVGKYKGSEPDVITVTRDGDRLIIQPSRGPRVQALPESETSFFATAFDAQVTFQKNGAGDVTRAVFRHDGKDETAEKLAK